MPRKKNEFEKEMIFCHKRLEQYADYIIGKYKYRNNNERYKCLLAVMDAWEKMIFEKLNNRTNT